MTALPTLPVLLPILGAALTVVVGTSVAAQRVIAVTTLGAVAAVAAVLLVTADRTGPVVAALGGWAAPVGIALVADRLSTLLLLVSTLVALAVLVYAISQRIADYGRRMASSTFYPMYLVLSAGVSLAYLSGDLFTLFVSFEIMLTASYVLITRRTTAQTIRAGMTYVTVSLLSSLLFLTAVGMVYAATATVNLADLSERVPTLPPGLQTVLALMFVVVFGIKAAMVPLHFWLPDSYPNAPAPVTALFAGLLTKVSFYAMVRTQTLLFPHDEPWTLMLWFASVTMLVGALGALAQNDINRLLSFLLVSHIGFMLFGLGVSDARGLSGATLYAAHHITVLATLFLVSGLIVRRTGTVALDRMGGLLRTSPVAGGAVRDPGDDAGRAAAHRGVRRQAAAAAGGRRGGGGAGRGGRGRDRRELPDAVRAGPGLGAGLLGEAGADGRGPRPGRRAGGRHRAHPVADVRRDGRAGGREPGDRRVRRPAVGGHRPCGSGPGGPRRVPGGRAGERR